MSPTSNATTVTAELHGAALLDFLEHRWPAADRTALRQLIDAQAVRVNAMPARGPRQRLVTGDLVACPQPPARRGAGREVAAGGVRLTVLHEEAGFLVVDKPAGMPTVPDRSGKDPGVHGRLTELRPGEDLRIVHRLDRETSGCLILARGLEAARFFDAAFRSGRVGKHYVALVEGRWSRGPRDVRRPLGPDRQRPGRVRVVVASSKGARTAHTHVEAVELFRRHSLVACRPTTGRGHQLRVHLASLGHPIVGDAEYGAERQLLLSRLKRGYKTRPGAREVPLVERLFLHAVALDVPRPDGDPVRVTSPLPEQLELALSKLRRFSSLPVSRREGGSP